MVKPVTPSFQDNYCFHEQKLLIAFHPMWSLYLGRQLDWADHHSTSRPVLKFEAIFLVSPNKFRIGNYIYLMVAYIEYIWLKKKSGRSNQSFVVLVKIAGKPILLKCWQ